MAKKILISIIRFYQTAISPFFPQTCRFYPNCSTYAIQAIEHYGVLKGLGKSAIRVLKCNPFHPGGYDPV